MPINDANNPADDLLTARQAAQLIPSTSAQTVLRWVREGILPAVRLPSGRVFVSKADILEMLKPVRSTGPKGEDQPELPFDELHEPGGES